MGGDGLGGDGVGGDGVGGGGFGLVGVSGRVTASDRMQELDGLLKQVEGLQWFQLVPHQP